MKTTLFAAALAVAAPAFAAVGVSITVGDPGFYGRLDIGDYPPPRVIYQQPRAVYLVPAERPPIYLRVPPGHRKHWSKNCHKYNACGERVYFVQDKWYHGEYVPRYQQHQRERRDDQRNEHRDDRRGDQGNDRGKKDHDNGRGKR
jgi:hypothetical protein